MSTEINPVRLPSILKENTVSTLAVNTPFYDDPGVVYREYPSDKLFLARDDVIREKTPKRLLGRVGIMHDFVLEGGNVVPGYVLDLRFAKARMMSMAPDAEMPDDQEMANLWLEEKRAMIPVAAVAYRNPETNKIQVAGDERFAASAIRLAKLSDELEQKIKKADAEAAKKLSKKTKSKSSRRK